VTRGRPPGLDLPELVEGIAVELGAGRSLGDAVRVVAGRARPELARELVAVLGAADRGLPLVVALDGWAAASLVPGAGLVAAAVGLVTRAGGDGSAALRGVADTLRGRRALDREIRALSAQARLSALVVAVAPLGFTALSVALDGPTARFLLATPAGWGCLLLGAGLDLAGWKWMQRLTGSVR
jgi:tight adherence protein B